VLSSNSSSSSSSLSPPFFPSLHFFGLFAVLSLSFSSFVAFVQNHFFLFSLSPPKDFFFFFFNDLGSFLRSFLTLFYPPFFLSRDSSHRTAVFLPHKTFFVFVFRRLSFSIHRNAFSVYSFAKRSTKVLGETLDVVFSSSSVDTTTCRENDDTSHLSLHFGKSTATSSKTQGVFEHRAREEKDEKREERERREE